jgi:hypothetical protein
MKIQDIILLMMLAGCITVGAQTVTLTNLAKPINYQVYYQDGGRLVTNPAAADNASGSRGHSSVKSSPFPFLLFVGVAISLSLQMSYFSSRKGGWFLFVMRYPVPNRPVAAAYTAKLAKFGSASEGQFRSSYKNVVRVMFTDGGIYFYVWPFLPTRAFHQPFLLPWPTVKRAEKSDGYLGEGCKLTIVDGYSKICLILPVKAEHDLFRFYQAV